jgi:4-diphosphocytidyl-2-C-methyl-D-erythritol kinase
MIREFHLRALAKINLDLRVLNKRPDDFHEIRTVFQTISLADRIRINYEPASELAISINGNIDIEDNLITRAARIVTSELQCGGVFRFRLAKRIPMGAGLGGGSSDAAATLLALPILLGCPVSAERLHALATQLGSDVPFFLHGGTAVGLGRGEELFPLPDFPALPGLLVTPDLHVSTPEAYRALSSRQAVETSEQKRTAFGHFAWTEDLSLAKNDFEEPVFNQHPALRKIREQLEAEGATCARMTGSGSSIFGLFADAEAARRAQQTFPAERTFAFTMVSRKRYRALWRKQTTFREELGHSA